MYQPKAICGPYTDSSVKRYLWDKCGSLNADLVSNNIKKSLLIFRSDDGIVLFSKGELIY